MMLLLFMLKPLNEMLVTLTSMIFEALGICENLFNPMMSLKSL
jgi:hypothetical protein